MVVIIALTGGIIYVVKQPRTNITVRKMDKEEASAFELEAMGKSKEQNMHPAINL